MQNPPAPIKEEGTASMRELVEQIDAHAEPEDTEAISIPSTHVQLNLDLLFSVAKQQQSQTAD